MIDKKIETFLSCVQDFDILFFFFFVFSNFPRWILCRYIYNNERRLRFVTGNEFHNAGLGKPRSIRTRHTSSIDLPSLQSFARQIGLFDVSISV